MNKLIYIHLLFLCVTLHSCSAESSVEKKALSTHLTLVKPKDEEALKEIKKTWKKGNSDFCDKEYELLGLIGEKQSLASLVSIWTSSERDKKYLALKVLQPYDSGGENKLYYYPASKTAYMKYGNYGVVLWKEIENRLETIIYLKPQKKK